MLRKKGTGVVSRSVVLIVPGRLDTCSGGYGYDRRIVAGLEAGGWSVAVRELDDSFPRPTSAALVDAARVLASMADGTTVIIDGLALGAMPDEVARERDRLRLVALVHHPLAAEVGLDPRAAAGLDASERRALAAVRLVVVTSRTTATALSAYDIDRQRIAVVEPGTDRVPLAHGSRGGPVSLLCVGALIPRKGHETLFRSLGAIPSRYDWQLTCVGSVQRDPAMVERLRARLSADGFADRVLLAGEVDAEALAAYYDGADVFVLPTLYEGYGMAVAEALARGLPVVSTPTGAIPDLVGRDAGLLVPAGDPHALAGALTDAIGDASLRQRLAAGTRRVREGLPTWREVSSKMADVLERGCDR